MGRIHHFGIVVPDIEGYLAKSLWSLDGPIVVDAIEKARLCMASLPGDPMPMIELIQPIDQTSRTWNAVQRGRTNHHVCLSVPTMQAGDELMREKRLLPITTWEPAELFGGRAIRFAYSRNRELLEFLADEVIS